MRIYRLLLLFFVVLLANHTELAAQTFLYVASNGSDANNGTSLTSAFKTIQKASNSALPGTTIIIKGGTYHERIIPFSTGTPGNEIILRPYQNDKVIIDAGGTNGWNIFTFYGQAYFRLENLIFQFSDNSVSAYQAAIGFGKNSHHVTINKCSFQNMINPNAAGISLWGDDTTVNGVHHITIDSCSFGDASATLYNGIVMSGNVHDVSISNSTIKHCRGFGIYCSGQDSVSKNPLVDFVRNVSIVHNVIQDNIDTIPNTTQNALYLGPCRNILIERNTILNNDAGIVIGHWKPNTLLLNHTIRNNIIAKNDNAGLIVGNYSAPNSGGTVRNIQVLNNTFFQNNVLGNTFEIVCFPLDSLTIANNLVYAGNAANFVYADWHGMQMQDVLIDYNIYASPFALPSAMNFAWNAQFCNGLGYFKSVSGQELHGDFLLPSLVDESYSTFDFHLYNNSPLIGKGSMNWMLNAGSFDIDGQARISGSAIDVGADENWNDYIVPNVGIAMNQDFMQRQVLYFQDGQWFLSSDLLELRVYNAIGQLVFEKCELLKASIVPLPESGVYLVRGTDVAHRERQQRIIY